MKKILLIICLIIQNSLLFASPTDTLTIRENENILLTNKYFLELEDPSGSYKINDVISNNGFHPVNSSLPVLKYSKSTTWLKFILKNKTTRAFVPVTIGESVIDSFDLYFSDHAGGKMIHFSSAVPYRDSKLIKQNNTFINAVILPDSTRTIYLRIKSRAPGVVPVEINSANTYFKNADFENILVGGFMGITIVMALYNLVLFSIVRDRSYLYYVAYIIFLGLSQVLLRGYGTSFFVSEKPVLNNYVIPLVRVCFGFAVISFAAEFLQLKRILKSYIWFYYLLYAFYTTAFVSIFIGQVVFAYNVITLSAGIVSITLLLMGGFLYFKGFKPAKFFMIGWGLFFVTVLISIGRNRGYIIHNEFTSNIIIYSSAVQLVLFSIALADKINFYRRQNNEAQLLSLTIAKENERLITQQNILLESEVNARTEQLINTNQNLSKTIENLKSAQIKLIETEKMASLGQLTAG
ncbi:MAG TPA: 7TM diverse intracellular signaling domain-containing protein, partial [Mucilaginibacter sp.]|nr:7TM diverse intracellular signaling domain-containing protein [Mucilaginibacter sp.]